MNTILVQQSAAAPLPQGRLEASCPRAPNEIAACGLPLDFLIELLVKVLMLRGRLALPVLAAHVCLSRSLVKTVMEATRTEQLVEIARGGTTELHNEYQLTDRGRSRAMDFMTRCGYAGPAPVSLDDYRHMVQRQSASHMTFSNRQIHSAFANITLQDGIADQIGAAMNSGRAILLYGPAGSGKTHLAELLTRVLDGSVLVPHAIYVAGDVVQVFDPLVHKVATEVILGETEPGLARLRDSGDDQRWIRCVRPLGLTGGELTLPMLDLQYDATTRFYQAPPHMKVNGGVFVVDDLGRQLVGARELMNRWIVPLDRQQDYLALHNGFKFSVPFDLTVVFSTNLHPTELADEAFLRRFGYKIYVGPLQRDDYVAIAREVCEQIDIAFDAPAFNWMIDELHARHDKALLACYPRDLLGRVKDFAIYENQRPEMTRHALQRAWNTYFVHADDGSVMRNVPFSDSIAHASREAS